ncbi:MAG: hypothetical protein ING19_01015 [Azospirillum sp.]|nr:hypothetical protein [Azospirillum sp.]
MASFYKRATPPQQTMLAIVAGAVVCAAKAHNVPIPKKFPRSVAKRAVGTLASQMERVLATVRPRSSDRDPARLTAESRFPSDSLVSAGKKSACPLPRHSGSPPGRQDSRRPGGSFRVLRRVLEAHIGAAKKAGEPGRADALIDVLRLMKRIDAGDVSVFPKNAHPRSAKAKSAAACGVLELAETGT